MNKQLFIVCPFSCMELYLQKKYGDDIFFLTATGAALQLSDYEYIMAVREFILKEKINTIHIVNDTACRFINNMLSHGKLFGLQSEKNFEEIYIDHYFSDFKDAPLPHRQTKLAEHNIRQQADAIMNSFTLGDLITDNNVEIKGLITSRKNNQFTEIQIKHSYTEVYEF